MTFNDLQVVLQDQAAFKRAFRDEEFINLVKGQFTIGRLPYIHQVTCPDGSSIRLKFYNVIKRIYNTKNIEIPGKESFLSYIEVAGIPLNIKAYSYTCDLVQVVWGTSKTTAQAKHDQAIANLTAQATELGIDLSTPTAWCSIYTESR